MEDRAKELRLIAGRLTKRVYDSDDAETLEVIAWEIRHK